MIMARWGGRWGRGAVHAVRSGRTTTVEAVGRPTFPGDWTVAGTGRDLVLPGGLPGLRKSSKPGWQSRFTQRHKSPRIAQGRGALTGAPLRRRGRRRPLRGNVLPGFGCVPAARTMLAGAPPRRRQTAKLGHGPARRDAPSTSPPTRNHEGRCVCSGFRTTAAAETPDFERRAAAFAKGFGGRAGSMTRPELLNGKRGRLVEAPLACVRLRPHSY